MANMGYCRFHNTREDLHECFEHLFDEDLSIAEARERQRLITLCRRIVHDVDANIAADMENA